MKNFRYYLCIFLFGFMFTTVKAQNTKAESLGLPGDNFNLYAVMKLFQESETLEGFEKSLNDENTHINNLDLDGDGNIDYIKIEDNVDGDVHTIVLKDAITPTENQDIAVFTVQRFANNEVQIQLIGDEELYGKNYIIEPNYEGDDVVTTANPGYQGNTVVVHHTTYVEVGSWPLIHFMFLPVYVAWHSPWYFGYYPQWWRPWRPYYWDYYYGYHHNFNHYYYGNYRHVNHYRYAHWNDNYYSHRRSHSQVVNQRVQEGRYKDTYSRPDTRKDGAELYRRTYQGNTVRPGNNQTRPGMDKSATRPGRNDRSTRMDKTNPSEHRSSTKPATRNEMGKPSTGQGKNRQAVNPDANRHSPKQGVNKPDSRNGNNKSTVKPTKNNKNNRQDKAKSRTNKDKGGR